LANRERGAGIKLFWQNFRAQAAVLFVITVAMVLFFI
jgi:hypothetical protein